MCCISIGLLHTDAPDMRIRAVCRNLNRIVCSPTPISKFLLQHLHFSMKGDVTALFFTWSDATVTTFRLSDAQLSNSYRRHKLPRLWHIEDVSEVNSTLLLCHHRMLSKSGARQEMHNARHVKHTERFSVPSCTACSHAKGHTSLEMLNF